MPPTSDLCHLIYIILINNCFTFNGAHFLQVQGTAMGTRMAPSYANIFMGRLEQKLLSTQPLQPLVWWRYIDDVFAIWTHGVSFLESFISHLNSQHPTIQFTSDWSSSSVSFLDTRLSLTDGRIHTDLFQKPTDTHQFLQWNSCHPQHNKTSIPYSQALHLHRICSHDDFQQRTWELSHHLRRRGYPANSKLHQLSTSPA